MQIDKGRRVKLSDLFTGDARFDTELSATGPGLAIDFACFGLDVAGKLSDDSYMTFFNQPKTPCGGVAITLASANAMGLAFDLELLPASIDRPHGMPNSAGYEFTWQLVLIPNHSSRGQLLECLHDDTQVRSPQSASSCCQENQKKSGESSR